MKLSDFKRLALIAAVSLSATAANAGTVSFSDSWNFGSSQFRDTENSAGASTRSATDQLSFSRFDSSMGTLTGVSLSFNSNWSYRSGIYADDGFNGFGREYAEGSGVSTQQLLFSLYDPASGQSSNYDSEYSSCSEWGSYSSASCANYERNSGAFNDNLDLSGINLNAWIGTTDNVNVFLRELRTAEVRSCGGDDNCNQWSWDNDWAGSASVTYTFDEIAVPEPGSLALLGLGLLGLGASWRKLAK